LVLSAGDSPSMRQLWAAPAGAYGSPIVVNDRLFSSGRTVSARTAADGSLLWTRTDLTGQLAMGGRWLDVVGSLRLQALDPDTGRTEWQVPFGGGSVTATDEFVYGVEPFGTGTRVRAFSAYTGALAWSRVTTFSLPSAPAVDGAVFVVG